MRQDLERLHDLLFVESRPSLASLVGLVSFLPPSLVKRAILLAEATDDAVLRAFLLRALAKLLPTKLERALLRNEAGVHEGPLLDLTTPASKQARRLMPQLTEEQRFEIFDRLFHSIEIEIGQVKPFETSTKKRIPRRTSRKIGKPAKSTEKPLRRPIVLKKRVRHPEAQGNDKDAGFESMPVAAGSPDYEDSYREGAETRDKDQDAGFESMPVAAGGPDYEESDREGAGGEYGEGQSSSNKGGRRRFRVPNYDDFAEYIRPGDDVGEGIRSTRLDDAAASTGAGEGFESAAAGAPEEIAQPPRRDIVNLGFSPETAADQYFMKDQQLQCGESYYFWLNIGYELTQSIGKGEALHVERLPSKARLKVAIFAFEEELQITPGEDVGELQLDGGIVTVAHQPTENRVRPVDLSAGADPKTLDDVLFFPVRTPLTEGTCRLRCNIYCEQLLVQSHVVSAQVLREPGGSHGALSARMDYSLSDSLRPAHLAAIAAEPHRLSLMINANGNGSAGFRFFGSDGSEVVKDDANIDGQQLSGFLTQARRALQKVSWGNEEAWDGNWEYRYKKPDKEPNKEPAFDATKLALDLAYLARAGWRIYSGFRQHLKTTARDLDKLMLQPGLVQIALKLSPRAVLPAAIVYQYPWKPDNFDFAKTTFELCPTFAAAVEKARNGGPALEDCVCFQGGCHLKALIDEITQPGSNKTLMDLPPMICPSGFWGYRHALGLPLTQDGTNSEAPPVITFKDQLTMVSAISTDQGFVERDPHFTRLEKMGQSLVVQQYKGYEAIVKRLKEMTGLPQLVYFYCHGGIRANSNLPYLEIGEKDRFDPGDIDGENINLKDTHPLVFINGCHTTSLNPEITLDFVSSFVQQVGASGVIGTEITIFEPLAVKFSEECLKRFLGVPPFEAGMPIGRAVRGARLELLKSGNPLGLVYIPYVMAGLRMVHETNPN